MQIQAQNKIYYKGNPYTRQNYIPNSALKNRKQQNFLVQFPQGQSYFGVSKKKQYLDLHNQSQIKQNGIFDVDEVNSYNHGTYQVADIEGAIPGTIISQAIKNRMKGNSRQHGRLNRKPRAYYQEQLLKNNQISQYQAQISQLQTRNPRKNYHFQTEHRKIHTQPSDLHNHIKHQLDFKYNPQHKYQPQSTQTQSANIKQLQQLLFKNQQNRLKQRSIASQQPKQTQQKVQNHLKINKSPNYQQDPYNRLSEKRIQNISSPTEINQKSNKDVRQMWHGDHHRLLFSNKDIRKFNPTYLSSDNYSSSGQVYSNNIRSPFP